MSFARAIGHAVVGLIAGGLVGCGSRPQAVENGKGQLGDSPVRVAGGSITFHSQKGWKGSRECPTQPLDTCTYLAGPLNTQNIYLAGFTSGNGSANQSTAWTITVYESNRLSFMKDQNNGIVIKSTDSNGNAVAPGASGFLTIQGLASDTNGFYPAMIPLDEYFQDSKCAAGMYPYCGQMAAADLNNVAYFCSNSSFGCNIFIGYTP